MRPLVLTGTAQPFIWRLPRARLLVRVVPVPVSVALLPLDAPVPEVLLPADVPVLDEPPLEVAPVPAEPALELGVVLLPEPDVPLLLIPGCVSLGFAGVFVPAVVPGAVLDWASRIESLAAYALIAAHIVKAANQSLLIRASSKGFTRAS